MARRTDSADSQIPLGISLAPGATFSAFYAGDNRFFVSVLETMAAGRGERQSFVAAAAGLGKSHLLQAACHHAADNGMRCAYLPLGGDAGTDPAILDGLATLDLVAIDGLERIAGYAAWERALFALIDSARSARTRVIVAAREVPGDLALGLSDLASRLAWGPVFQLTALDETDKRAALMHRAQTLGLTLPGAVADYLLRYYSRDLATQLERLNILDRAALARGRRLTVPFVKEVLEG